MHKSLLIAFLLLSLVIFLSDAIKDVKHNVDIEEKKFETRHELEKAKKTKLHVEKKAAKQEHALEVSKNKNLIFYLSFDLL